MEFIQRYFEEGHSQAVVLDMLIVLHGRKISLQSLKTYLKKHTHILIECVPVKHTIMPLLCQGHCCTNNNPLTKQYLVSGDPVIVSFL